MRLESTDLADRQGAQEDLESLARRLRREGFAVQVAQPNEPTWSRLRKSAGAEVVHVLSVILNEAETSVVPAVVALVMGWAASRIAHRGGGEAQPTVIFWVLRDDDHVEELREEPLPDRTEGE
jgi:hypothetical protein